MMTMRRLRWLMLAALATAAAGCAHRERGGEAAAAITAAERAAIAARVEAAIAPTPFSGAIVLGRDGRILYAQGFGAADREAGRRFEVDTPADGASIAKTFTAAAVHLLAAEGRLSLDDPVQRHLPAYPHAATRVRHLLTHSAGLPDYEHFDRTLPPGALRTTEAMLALLARDGTPPAFAPGTRFEYSSLAYDVAAQVVQRAGGRPFAQFVAERFFAPLGLTTAFARPAFFADWPGPRTIGYRQRDGAWQRFDVDDGEAFVGGSNLYLSASDLSRWAGAFVQAGRLPEPVLRASTAGASLDDGRALALSAGNWYCDDTRARCQYSGHLNAFHCVVHWDRMRGTTMAYISNHTLDPWLTPQLTRELIAAADGRAAPPREAPEPDAVDAATLPALAGRYTAPSHGPLELALRGSRLHVIDRRGVEYRAFRVTRRAFYVPGLDWWLGFSGGAPPDTLHIRSIAGDERARRIAAAAAIGPAAAEGDLS